MPLRRRPSGEHRFGCRSTACPRYCRLGPDMDKAGKAFLRHEAQKPACSHVVDRPISQPLRGKSKRMCPVEKVHTCRTGRQYLLPFGDLHMRSGTAHEPDHNWRPGKPVQFGVLLLSRKSLPALQAEAQQPRSSLPPPLAIEKNESPRGQLAMIRNANSGGNDLAQLARIGPGRPQQDRRYRSAGRQEIDDGRHDEAWTICFIGAMAMAEFGRRRHNRYFSAVISPFRRPQRLRSHLR